MESGFKFLNLFLIECDFKRAPEVTFDVEKLRQDVNINVSYIVDGSTIAVTETINFKQIASDISEIEANITMTGIFERFGDIEIDTDQFANVNAAAIIFPFIREQLTNLSSKAGLGLLLLQPVNFQKVAKQ